MNAQPRSRHTSLTIQDAFGGAPDRRTWNYSRFIAFHCIYNSHGLTGVIYSNPPILRPEFADFTLTRPITPSARATPLLVLGFPMRA